MQGMATIADFLTADEINTVEGLYKSNAGDFHQRVLDEVIVPNLHNIVERLRHHGQEIDPHCLAEGIEYCMKHLSKYGADMKTFAASMMAAVVLCRQCGASHA